MAPALTCHISTFMHIQSERNMDEIQRCGGMCFPPGEVLRFLLSEEHKDFLLVQGSLAH